MVLIRELQQTIPAFNSQRHMSECFFSHKGIPLKSKCVFKVQSIREIEKERVEKLLRYSDNDEN